MKHFFILGSILIVTALLGAFVLWIFEDNQTYMTKSHEVVEVEDIEVDMYEIASDAPNNTALNSTSEAVVQILPVLTGRPYIPALRSAVIGAGTVLRGQIPGPWMFEGSFPVTLYNANGDVLAQGYGQADGEWMTTGYVPFTIQNIDFRPYQGETVTLVLSKDNPSGMAELDDSETYTFSIRE